MLGPFWLLVVSIQPATWINRYKKKINSIIFFLVLRTIRSFGLNEILKTVWVVPIYNRTSQSLGITQTGSFMLAALCMRHHASANFWVVFFPFEVEAFDIVFVCWSHVTDLQQHPWKIGAMQLNKKKIPSKTITERHDWKCKKPAFIHHTSVSRPQLRVTLLIEKKWRRRKRTQMCKPSHCCKNSR